MWRKPASLLLFAGLCGCGDELGADFRTSAIMNGGDWRDEIIYQLMVDRFADGDINNNHRVEYRARGRYQGGDWQGVINNLDYLEALGVTTLWISPVVKNVDFDAGFDAYHGYWTQDMETVNPHFGTPAKLRELVQKAHERRMKVILDIVTNHMGQLFYYDIDGNGIPSTIFIGSNSRDKWPGTNTDIDGLAQLLRHDEFDPDFDRRGVQGFSQLGESGPAQPRFLYMPEINRVPPPPIRFGPKDYEVLDFQRTDVFNRAGRVTNYDAQDQLTGGDFPGGLKDLDTRRVDVRRGLIKAFAGLIRNYDFDGFRIDTLKHVEHEFWATFAPAIREFARGERQIYGVEPLSEPKKNWFMFGEAFDGDDALLGEFTYGPPGMAENSEMESVFYFSQKFQVYGDVVRCGSEGTKKVETLWNDRLRFDAATARRHEHYRSCYPGRCFRQCTGVNGDGSPKCEQTLDQAEGKPIYNQQPVDKGPVDESGKGIPSSKLLVNFIDNHDVARFLSPIGSCGKDGDPSRDPGRYQDVLRKRLRSALALMLTQDGIPCLYYGTEQEFSGGNDPSNRENLFGTLTRNFYLGQAALQREPLWGSGYGRDTETFKWLSRLTSLRKRYAPLRRGDLLVTWASDHKGSEPDAMVLGFTRSYGGKAVLVVHNFRDGAYENGAFTYKDAPGSTAADGKVMKVAAFAAGTRLVDILQDDNDRTNEGQYTLAGDQTVTVRVSPRATKILVPESDVQR